MLKRTITGIIMAGILFLMIYLTSFSHFVFDALVLIIGALASFEIYSAVKKAETNIEGKQGYNISLTSMIVMWACAYPLCYFFGYIGLFFGLIFAIIVAFIIFIFDEKKTFNDFAVNCFALVYPMTLLSIVFIMNKNYGMIPVLLAIGISTISDAMAYFVGATLGKKKIFPKISPKKTYAGCIGGVIGGAIGGVIVYLIFELGKMPTHILFTFSWLLNNNTALTIVLYAVVGLIMAVFSEIGDLAASRVKRNVGIKDYGKILGSHGGILDRIDSVLFSIFAMGLNIEIINIVRPIAEMIS